MIELACAPSTKTMAGSETNLDPWLVSNLITQKQVIRAFRVQKRGYLALAVYWKMA
jgi:hypothetical protein